MKTFCTLSDWNYVHYGISLYRSLLVKSSDFKLYYLCLDKQTYDYISGAYKNIIPIFLDDLLEKEEELRTLKEQPASFESINVGRQKGVEPKKYQFMWALASYFSYYLMEKYDLEDITYLDSDLYFYNDWKKIFNVIGDRSIGLTKNNAPNENNGIYNVSLIYFKNDIIGNQALWSWRNWLLDSNNEYYKEYGQCGDQKYLELFSKLFGKENICVLDDEGILQLSPWSLSTTIQKRDIKEISFYHFSDFSYEAPARRHGINSLEQLEPQVIKLYESYSQMLKIEETTKNRFGNT